ncbi:MAG: hypothetical protein RLZZ597_2606, partial [Cyanobacteriota bacterium]
MVQDNGYGEQRQGQGEQYPAPILIYDTTLRDGAQREG